MGIVWALLALSVMIFIHELGHYLAAKFFGVKVERFSIGFGPVLAKKECCGNEWAISALPLGGYVQMKGQDDTDPGKMSSDPDSYSAKKPWQRIIILLAGPFANFFLAYLLYFAIAIIGFQSYAPVIGKVLPDSPALQAGLQKGDRIVAVDGHKVETWSQMSAMLAKNPHRFDLLIERNGKKFHIQVAPKVRRVKNLFGEEIQRPMIGIAPAEEYITTRLGVLEATKYAWNKTIDAARFIVIGIEKMIEGVVSPKEIGGVITIVDVTAKASQIGITAFLALCALISVNLGILNLLPIPALDGGHIMINLYEMITRRPPSPEMLYRITYVGWIFIIGLMGLGLYNDINRLLGAH